MTTTSGRSPKDYRPRHARKKPGGGNATTSSRSTAAASARSPSAAVTSGRRGASERTGPKGRRPRGKKGSSVATGGPSLAFAAGLLGFAVAAVAYVRIDLPKALPPVQTTFVTDRNGELLATFHGSVDRTIIPLRQMPPHLRNAVIAVEDARFYEHDGVD